MKYALTINEHNIKPHLDIENDIQKKKNGLLTFNLVVNQGNIESYAQYETVTHTQYQGIIFTISQERTFTFDPRTGVSTDGLRSDEC